MTNATVLKFIGFVALILLALVIVIITSGCVAKTSGSYVLDEEIRRPDTGELVYSKRVRSGAAAEAPANAAGPTTQTVGETGISTSVSGTHAKPLGAYGLEQRQMIFYGGAAALVIAAAVAFWLSQRMLAACLLAAAGILGAGEAYVGFAPWLVGGALLIGIAWTAATIYRSRKANHQAAASAIKLGSEGKPFEAVAALRESPLGKSVSAK